MSDRIMLVVFNIPTTVPSVVGLLFSGGPSAVLWAVVAIIVNSFKRKSWWSFSHVGQEVFKLIPSFAKGYATASVILPFCGFIVGASCSHFGPAKPSRGVAESMSCVIANGLSWSNNCFRHSVVNPTLSLALGDRIQPALNAKSYHNLSGGQA